MRAYKIFINLLISMVFLPVLKAQKTGGISLQSIDTNITVSLAKAIQSTDIIIGLFEFPQIMQAPIALKSEIIPEAQNNYLDIVIKNDLIKLNLIKSVKGNFDNAIFIKRQSLKFSEGHNYIPQQILAFPGTKWLILLKKASLNDSSKNWSSAIKTDKVKLYINANTLFDFAENAYGAVCLEWPANLEKPDYVQMAPLDLISDLQIIVSHTSNLQKIDKDGYEKEKQLISDSLSTAYGKAIIKAMEKKHY